VSHVSEEPLLIGALAERAGMSVRMLHHYDRIGLLKPSARSGASYRLYSANDIARLHAIQALRQLGLSLKEIQLALQDKSDPLPQIVARQLASLEQQIEQSRLLCEQLRLLKSRFEQGDNPALAERLRVLSAMSACGKYFRPAELTKIFASSPRIEERWPPLIAEIRDAMRRHISIDTPSLQQLAQRWMDLSLQMAQGDYDLMKRWEQMYLQEPAVRGKAGDDIELVTYINRAIALRVEAFHRHFTPEEFRLLDFSFGDDWEQLTQDLAAIQNLSARSRTSALRRVRAKWQSLVDKTARNDKELAEKFVTAFASEPLLRAGSTMGQNLEQLLHEDIPR
jgi:DNA-binding transcriptional MerR regulator